MVYYNLSLMCGIDYKRRGQDPALIWKNVTHRIQQLREPEKLLLRLYCAHHIIPSVNLILLHCRLQLTAALSCLQKVGKWNILIKRISCLRRIAERIRRERISVQIAGGVGGLNPLPHLADSGQNSTPGGGRVSTPHLSFAEVGMLLYSHFLLMQFLKYLQRDDLNVTTILIHIED